MTGTYRTRLVSIRDGDEGFVHLSNARNIGRHGKKANRRKQRRDHELQKRAALREHGEAGGFDGYMTDFDRAAMAWAEPHEGPILSMSFDEWFDDFEAMDHPDFGFDDFDDEEDDFDDDVSSFLDHGWDEVLHGGSVYDFLYAGDTSADDNEDE